MKCNSAPAVLLGIILVVTDARACFTQAAMTDGSRCPSCRIESVRVARIDRLADYPVDARRIPTGRYVVALPDAEDGLIVYDSVGNRLTQIGRRGEGPGEFRYPILVRATSGDSLMIFDQRLARLSIWTSALQYVRQIPLPVTTETFIRLGDGSFVVNARVRSADRIGLPLHRITAAGEIAASFGDLDPTVLPNEQWISGRLIAGEDSSVWSVPAAGNYELEQWSSAGTRTRVLRRDTDWYPNTGKIWNQTAGRPPYSRMRALWLSDGLLWVVALVPAKEWKDGTGPVRTYEGGIRIYEITDLNKTFDTVVEVIEASTGDVLATRRFDEAFGLDIATHHVGVVHENRDITFTLSVFRLALIGR